MINWLELIDALLGGHKQDLMRADKSTWALYISDNISNVSYAVMVVIHHLTDLQVFNGTRFQEVKLISSQAHLSQKDVMNQTDNQK